MHDRKKILVHTRRISNLIERAIRDGPDGSLEGKFADEHPIFVHTILGFYLAGNLGYLESEDGSYSWNRNGTTENDFDVFASNFPAHPKDSFASKNISKNNLKALSHIRNAVIHNNGDLSLNHSANSLSEVQNANLPGVILNGSVVTLESEFLEFVRLSTLAVRFYHGDE